MNEMKDSFVFYRSFYEAVRELSKDIQLEVYSAIIEYALNGRRIDGLKPISRSIFSLVLPQLDANNARYRNGIKGGRPPKVKKTEVGSPMPFTEEVESLKKDSEWRRETCLNLGIAEEVMEGFLDKFLAYLQSERKDSPHKDIYDAKRHFCYWFRHRGTPTASSPPPSMRYSSDGFGSIDN